MGLSPGGCLPLMPPGLTFLLFTFLWPPILSSFPLKLRPKLANKPFLLSPKQSWDSQTFLHWMVINSNQRIVTHSERSITTATFPKEKFGTPRELRTHPRSLELPPRFPGACLQVSHQYPTADAISIYTCEVRSTILAILVCENQGKATRWDTIETSSNLGLFLFIGLCLFFSLIFALGHIIWVRRDSRDFPEEIF